MDVVINNWGVFWAAVASMAVGSIWYAKSVFGTAWIKMAGVDEKRAKTDAPMAMAGMFVLGLVMAYVLAHVSYLSANFFTDYSYQKAAVVSGFWVWLGFVLPVVASGSLFEQRRKKLSAINAGNWLVTLLVMGWVIGMVGL
ncbi:MAG TPA: DUF1761 domain-containing protein [Candidatus Saccharimonadales bacterium]